MGTWPGWPLQRSRVWGERKAGTKAQVTYPAGQRPRTGGRKTEGDLETVRDLHMGKETDRERQRQRDRAGETDMKRPGGREVEMATHGEWPPGPAPHSPLVPAFCSFCVGPDLVCVHVSTWTASVGSTDVHVHTHACHSSPHNPVLALPPPPCFT